MAARNWPRNRLSRFVRSKRGLGIPIDHGGGGIARIETISDAGKRGVRLIFEDKGPGIVDLGLAMQDGYTSGSGLGMGLPGSKRLSNEFCIESTPGKGTKVTLVRWKNV